MYFEIIGEIESIEQSLLEHRFAILRDFANATALVVGEN